MHSSPPPHLVTIRDTMIRLGQFLKLASLAESGAHARDLIEDDNVYVNGELEKRRGRQLIHGDIVTVTTPQTSLSAQVITPAGPH
ncbi:RNA-binding S4 domain-containing protein [Jonesia denitrificans]|uniref:RNA-binding S4 domain protein n=1 Tax=Jonesia denitrificans (strain ATCC 14870 / DSM 20603 / BCRC 15368 / CIP 55.134 / JCM 11481 / NBRC 15587 / NCTC 10816 / Prevot 55134) TaxID=471856 RepID=C7R3K8_JONDD|nr:RNA-binding S4 domain-containing protein [Jonesia denitrificans]ACV08744.1 RNA-binding S4 domain protein [Jonesia denitrificans DSM 20603]ASE09931.1 RNA-binding S4 domain-containing protein [Jonesia denitrificans]QXB42266.1 RNA-binding S4 domain-containing protein [Jonesia denitrificans]SQH20733.1 ribosome-associated protein [Jonesia denitrificans]